MKKIISNLRSIYAYIKFLYLRKKITFKIKDSLETLDYIIKNKVSVSRFGDGEFLIIKKKSIGFQEANEELGTKLLEILQKPIEKHITCLPYYMFNQNNVKPKSAQYWRSVFLKHWRLLNDNCKQPYYFDACFTRFYMIFKKKDHAPIIINKIKMLWDKRNICIVEGENTCFGINNDFLDNVQGIERIICPSADAFSYYESIINTIKAKIQKDKLILIALGATATALAYDLTELGYQAIDIGHADIEYMWYKMGATEKCAIPGKAVNEVGINHTARIQDENYQKQIIATIL